MRIRELKTVGLGSKFFHAVGGGLADTTSSPGYNVMKAYLVNHSEIMVGPHICRHKPN